MKFLAYAVTVLATLAAVAAAALFYAAVWATDVDTSDNLAVSGFLTLALLIPLGCGAAYLLLSELDD